MEIFQEPDVTPGANGARARNQGRPPGAKTKPAAVKVTTAQMRTQLTQQFSMYAMVAMAFDKHYDKDGEPIPSPCALAYIEQNEAFVDALVTAAEDSPALRKALTVLVATGTFGQVGAALLPVFMVVAQNHIPAFRDATIDAH
jgi:hypothetical protein